MKKTDAVFLIINGLLCTLVWLEYFTGGYHEGLTQYNVWIVRLWALIAAITLFYCLINLGAVGAGKVVNWILMVYSIITSISVAVIIIIGI